MYRHRILHRCGQALAALLLTSQTTYATLPAEALNQHERMLGRDRHNIVTISDALIPYTTEGRVHFVNGDDGKYLGALNTGYWYGGVVLPKTRSEIISPETYFERGSRGKRSDWVVFYDPVTLQPIDEVAIPSKRMTPVKPQATTALTDDEKFLAVQNVTPATSISIVDLDTRTFVTEIETPGCTYIYPVGNRVFNAICADGSFMRIEIDDKGELVSRSQRPPSFDPITDPITNGGVRVDNSWYHVSHQSYLHRFTTAVDGSIHAEKWSLLSDDERADNWRIAGMQQLALHRDSGRLYVLMIQGDPETFEDPTDQVWVYDLKSKQRLEILELERPALFMNVSQGQKARLHTVAIDFQMPLLFTAWIYFTQGKDHLTRMTNMSFDTYDLNSGELLHALPQIGRFPNLIQPWQ